MRRALPVLLALAAAPAAAAPPAAKHCVALNHVDRIRPADDRII